MSPSPALRRALRAARIPALLGAVALAAGAGAPSVWRGLLPGGAHHTVLQGESLWEIARSNGTTVAALKAANALTGDLILAGQTLTLPGNGAAVAAPAMSLAAATTPAPSAAATTTTSYTVRTGDTLTSIAHRAGTTTARLLALNPLADPDVVVLGSRLRLPAAPPPVAVPAAASLAAAVPGSDAAALAAAVFSPPSPRYAAAVARDRALLSGRAQPAESTVAALIRAEALRQGVPVSLALAVATQESGLQQNLVSRTDAIGVMQLMPGTADWLATDVLGAPVDRTDAASNIRAGVAYLRVLLRQADTSNAVAGYYQGLGNVLAHGMSADTRAYVASVLALQRSVG